MLRKGDWLCHVAENYITSVQFVDVDEEGDLIVSCDGREISVFVDDCFFLCSKEFIEYK